MPREKLWNKNSSYNMLNTSFISCNSTFFLTLMEITDEIWDHIPMFIQGAYRNNQH